MWNFQQSLQPKQAAEGLMFLIRLIQKPAKMTHFKNNNKPCQIFNHNKESEGRPIYFFFYTLHLLAWPERHAQMPAICSSTKWSLRSLPPWLPSRTARPGWWNCSLLAEAVDGSRLEAPTWELGCGGDVSRCLPYYAVYVLADLTAPLQPTAPRESA